MFRILVAAELEMFEIADQYNVQRPGLGIDFLVELELAYARIQRAPLLCGRLEQFFGSHDIRYLLVRRFPYLVIFRCVADDLSVIAVSHAKREPLYWLERLD